MGLTVQNGSLIKKGDSLGTDQECCCEGCSIADGKPRTDPVSEGTWVPSGTWRGVSGVTWSFTANPGDDSGQAWFFYGSASTSKAGGGATIAEQRDWENLCNWYSNKTSSPDNTSSLTTVLDKRATRLPPTTAIIHIYTPVSTGILAKTVKHAYFWGSSFLILSPTAVADLATTDAAHDSTFGAVFNDSSSVGAGITPFVFVNGGATLNDNSINFGAINDGATFNLNSRNDNEVNGGAVFNDTSDNRVGIVNDGATFNDNSINGALAATVNGGATFNDNSQNSIGGTVNGGATFNDAACSQRVIGNFFASPCTRRFVAHPTDLPVCNGTAPAGCDNVADNCGCG